MKTICSNCEAENEINSKYCSVCGYKLPILENQNMKTKIEHLKVMKPKKKLDLKTLIGVVVGVVVGLFVTQSLFQPSIDKQLAEMASVMNKTCPMNIDEYTTLKNVVALPNKTVQYNYILVGIIKAEVQLDTVKKYVFPGVLQNVKTNPQMKFFRDNNVTLNYYYSDKNGEFVTQYAVKPEMYE
ncbi:zinc ribbon domain-containing protein [Flavobacterium sp. RSP49]|uniref:zinc ribbon domain-containing protein n=1 Tax=Flavobacterium sp. RSP49 TaxID=2497487 RepID=UPI000F84473F|nr:zinc ribbon domain-containing protein [Flavobacterium sp. RSP49]RTY99975.1 zinc ribbon domain-containing protein [Flavobacterium sp. RSP49]